MQRVALILALASSPRLLLCDEPTSALGRTHRQRMVERLRLAMANGVGLIIATHDRALIDELGADPWSMDRGGEESGGG
jgi:ABC-type glutathione transport system ATPase component